MADIITTKQASENWGVTSRRVNEYIRDGKIEGAHKIGSVWVIPADAKKPADARFRGGKYANIPQPVEYANAVASPDMLTAFQKLLGSRDAFFQFLDLFPYMIEIFATDGTAVFLNRAGCEDGNMPDASQVVGHYNILKDTVVLDVLGQRDIVERAFQGERIDSRDVRIPYEDTTKRYAQADKKFARVLYKNISCFPILDERQRVLYVAMVFITAKTYTGRLDMIRAQEYMDAHWREPFDRDSIAAAVKVSPTHFSRMFKQHAHCSPLEYYQRVKVDNIREKLLDPNLTVKEAFAACGVSGKGAYLRHFEEIAGMTPTEYRKRYMAPKEP